MPGSFDARAVAMAPIGHDWDPEVQEQWRSAQAGISADIRAQFGERELDRKLNDFIAIGSAPFSVIAFHNALLQQCRDAFVLGAYYPSLVGVCALGERILNELVVQLRDANRASEHYGKLRGKQSFDDWNKASKILEDWDVFDAAVSRDFRELAKLRNASVHYNPMLDPSAREPALTALRLMTRIIDQQFGTLPSGRWFIPDGGGVSFIRADAEDHPFVKTFYLPHAMLVGPNHDLEFEDSTGRWLAVDPHEYPAELISDEEFLLLFQQRPVASKSRVPPD